MFFRLPESLGNKQAQFHLDVHNLKKITVYLKKRKKKCVVKDLSYFPQSLLFGKQGDYVTLASISRSPQMQANWVSGTSRYIQSASTLP